MTPTKRRKIDESHVEIYGKKDRVYAQNLWYLAKLFLDQETLYYDVDLFMFYIMCECDDRGTPHGWILFKGKAFRRSVQLGLYPSRLQDSDFLRHPHEKAEGKHNQNAGDE
uniref:Histone acetyltransferase n=1 Tax=Brassica campestris TaxID=3711 RepID=A0A3P5YW82_BRACM|nr:unnamed protein product [Brassica rapa]